jgi:hypothetical protein
VDDLVEYAETQRAPVGLHAAPSGLGLRCTTLPILSFAGSGVAQTKSEKSYALGRCTLPADVLRLPPC